MIRNALGTVSQAIWRLSCATSPKGVSISRYSMYRLLREQFGERDLGNRVLSISHSRYLCALLGASDDVISEANYPEQSVDKLAFEAGTFSAVVSDQVFEHIKCTPTEAVDEVHRVLRPGGLAIHTTCFLTPYHGSNDIFDLDNGDFWRFTRSGLARLHKDYSQIIAADGWGNALMPILGGLNLSHMPVPERTWHPLNKLARLNRDSYAHSVWIIARK